MNIFENAAVVLWSSCPGDLEPAEPALTAPGCRVRNVTSRRELLGLIERESVDLVIISLRRSCPECLDWLAPQVRGETRPAVLVVADLHDVHLYMEALQRGAYDGLGFPIDEKELMRLAESALQAHRSKLCHCAV